MQISKRVVGQPPVIDGKLNTEPPEVNGERLQGAVEMPKDAPIFLGDVLRELSRAAQEALTPERRTDNEKHSPDNDTIAAPCDRGR